ncbi:MAG: serine/threonine-protein kinase [Stygiobacter sp.]
MQNLIGKKFQGYEFLEYIGEGGMGIVYKAQDLNLDRKVAIKVIQPGKSNFPQTFKKFRKEAKNQAKLIHPNIVTIHGLIEIYSSIGIVMEFVDGEELSSIIKRKQKLDYNFTKNILLQVLDGLDFAHSHGIIHRDIKPSNIIVRKDGVAKIADFGIAKSVEDFETFTTNSKMVGTLFYMSPEQITGAKVSHLSDIYSLGCTAYEMATGLPPFYYQNTTQIIFAHINEIAAPIESFRNDYPDAFNKLIFEMLQKDAKLRPKSCNYIKNYLRIITQANVVSSDVKAFRKKSNNSFLITLIKIVFIILTIIIVYFVVTNVKINR